MVESNRAERRRRDAGVSTETVHALLVDLKADLRDMRQEHGDALGDIRKETRDTNGKVAEALTRIAGHDREIGEVKRDVRGLKAAPTAAVAVVNEPGESFQVSGKVSPKIWAVIASIITALLAFGPTISRWFERLVDRGTP